MTISPDDRREERAAVLISALSRIGDSYLESVIFTAGKDLPETHRTTWQDLVERRFLRPLGEIGIARYLLTPAGWLEAHRISGVDQSSETRTRLSRLMAFFKREADRAAADGPQVQHAAIDAQYGQIQHLGIPADWIHNAVISGLLAQAFPKDNVNVKYHSRLYRVPVNFGRKRID
jgi:hypothetical protein